MQLERTQVEVRVNRDAKRVNQGEVLSGETENSDEWADSQTFAIQFLFNKFNPPVIDGGQIYVPNYNGGVDLYRRTQ